MHNLTNQAVIELGGMNFAVHVCAITEHEASGATVMSLAIDNLPTLSVGDVRPYFQSHIDGVPTVPMRVVGITGLTVRARPAHLPPGPEYLTYDARDFLRWYPHAEPEAA